MRQKVAPSRRRGARIWLSASTKAGASSTRMR